MTRTTGVLDDLQGAVKHHVPRLQSERRTTNLRKSATKMVAVVSAIGTTRALWIHALAVTLDDLFAGATHERNLAPDAQGLEARGRVPDVHGLGNVLLAPAVGCLRRVGAAVLLAPV